LQDIAEAAAWYDEQKYPGLGDHFLDAFYPRNGNGKG
jgi:hypothetical protein